MAHKKHKGMKHHTGPVHHTDMNDHLPGIKDEHMHESHSKGMKAKDGAGGQVVGHANYGGGDEEDEGESIGSNEC